MKRHPKSLREFLNQSFAQSRQLGPERVESACERVLERLRENGGALPEFAAVAHNSVRSPWRFPRLAAAAVVVLVLVSIPFVRTFFSPESVYAIVETVNGSVDRVANGGSYPVSVGEKIDRGKVLRANGGADAAFTLADGSHIEMRSNSEWELQTAEDGALLQLNAGSIIVTAAKRHNGHLYVRTKDVTVSVIDSVFFVSTEKSGSRVAVIQGEADVQSVQPGTMSKKLRPGEQIATNPVMELHSVGEEIAWSRTASTLLVLLQQSTARAVAPRRLQFEVVSIKLPYYPRTARFVCRGIDGTIEPYRGATPSASDTVVGQQGIEGPLVVANGRCVGQPDLIQLVSVAYGVPQFDISINGPDWVARRRGGIQRFSIEAKAEDVASVTKEQLRQMLQSMLADRFKLKIRREPKEVQGFALLVSKSGLKLKEVSGELELPHNVYDATRPITELVTKGKSPLKDLADYLMPFVSYGQTAFPVLDKTGLTGIYEYTLTLHQAAQGAQRGGGGGDIGGGFDPPVSRALEQQFGLTLQAQKVQSEAIVIDQVEKPSEN